MPDLIQCENLPEPLSREFFARDTLRVAKELLGKQLVRFHPEFNTPLILKIVETEAYTGNDPACHAYGRKTGRAATLYKAPGTAYVYFIYGMYFCLNVVTEPEGQAGAVLFRALEPNNPDHHGLLKTNGPGRLSKALQITKAEHNELDLSTRNMSLYLAEGATTPDSSIIETTRIGIREATDYPWRFCMKDNPWVSVKP